MVLHRFSGELTINVRVFSLEIRQPSVTVSKVATMVRVPQYSSPRGFGWVGYILYKGLFSFTPINFPSKSLPTHINRGGLKCNKTIPGW